MTFQTLELYQAPAAPAPAPSQIRFPKSPQQSRISPMRRVETLYATALRVLSTEGAERGQEYPTRLH